MKALTLWQPWASLVAIGAKGYETRSWSTRHRGPLAIHAAQKPIAKTLVTLDAHTKEVMELALNFRGDFKGFATLPVGCIVATCELRDVYPVEEVYHSLYNLPNEAYFGDFSAGRFAWWLEDVQELDKPIPARGAQRLWEWMKPI